MSKQTLFDEDSEDEVSLKTENEYAKKYDKWREKEELHKLEQKYGSKSLNSDASESSDSEDESDEPPEVSEEQEAQFLKTLALLKTKDPRIYDPSFKFFEEGEKKEVEESKPKQLTFADSDDDDDDGNIFTIEKKAEIDTRQRKTSETKEAKLKEYLTGQAEHLDAPVERDLAPLKALWSDPKLNEGEAFLRDYILNKKYLEDGDAGEAEDKLRDDEELETDEQRVEEQGKFERAYNFRFEEPDQEYLKRFPRTMNYIRPKDERRSTRRAEVRARKDAERNTKMEEIARLKALKLKEIQEKIAKIKEVTGNEDLAFKDEDLESEFDPSEHDKRMREIFDEHYYGDADEHKPVFPDLDEELEIENWEKYQPEYDEETQQTDEPHCEDEDFNMDAEYDPKRVRANLLEEVQKTLGKKRRNRKKKSKLAELLVTEKPKFIPTVQKSYDEYMDEYYKMDCEDIIGDLPTRFKYRDVVPNDYGLSVEEILLADDKELTQWVPLKKILKHRPDNLEKGDAKTYALKAADVNLKRKVLPSLFKDLPEEPEIVVPLEETKKKKKKKKRNKQKNEQSEEDNNENKIQETVIKDSQVQETNNSLDNNEEIEVRSKKGKKRKHKESIAEQKDDDIEDSPKESKKEKVHNTTVTQDDGETPQNSLHIENMNESPKKKKKKNTNNEVVTLEEVVIEIPKMKDRHKKNSINEDLIKKLDTEQEINIKTKNITEFTVETVTNATPTQISSDSTISKGKGKKNKVKPNLTKVNGNNAHSSNNDKNKQKNNTKNKKGFKKNLKKDKFKKNNNKSGNPLGNLSDERLKAYGLNPKKYKNFLMYKKF